MFKILFTLILLPTLSWGLTFKDGKQVDDSSSSTSSTNNSSQSVKNEDEAKSFQPFECKKLNTDYLRVNKRNDCLIIQELSNEYEVKSHEVDPNTWNKPQLKIH